MTEAEWLACNDPRKMLRFLRDHATERKRQLIVVACCRHNWAKFISEDARHAVELVERFADEGCQSLKTNLELGAAHLKALEATNEARRQMNVDAWHAAEAARMATHVDFDEAEAAYYALGAEFASDEELELGCQLVRDVMPNPVRLVDMKPTWITANTTTLATAIYADRAFDRLPILADALEDAGCTDRAILDHCRQPGEHVRGCWIWCWAKSRLAVVRSAAPSVEPRSRGFPAQRSSARR